MKILIRGSTQYWVKFESLKTRLENKNHIVKIPAFDHNTYMDELELCVYNRDLIEWADEIHLIWDGRSVGTIFDFGMVFMSRKPLVIEYIEPKSFTGVMRKYEEFCNEHKIDEIRR